MSTITARIGVEIELHLTGEIVPYMPATGPSYSSGGEPAEGGYAEDYDIEDITVAVKDEKKRIEDENGKFKRFGTTNKSILTDVDLKNPEVRKLLINIMELCQDDINQALIEADTGDDYYEED